MNAQWVGFVRASLSDAGGWAMTALRIIVIVIVAVAWNVTALLQGLIRRFRERVARRLDDVEAVERAEPLGRVMAVVHQVAQGLRDDAAFRDRIRDKFEMAGVEPWDPSAIAIRGRFQVAPLAQWDVRREHLRRLKAAFDLHGIEIPFPQLAPHAPAGLLGPARPLVNAGRTAP